MSLVVCRECQVIENTNNCHYWAKKPNSPTLCSQCDPNIGKWHNRFPRNFINGSHAIGENGFLYNPDNPPTHVKLVGIV